MASNEKMLARSAGQASGRVKQKMKLMTDQNLTFLRYLLARSAISGFAFQSQASQGMKPEDRLEVP